MAKYDEFKGALEKVRENKTLSVNWNHNQVMNLLNKIDTSELNSHGMEVFDSFHDRLSSAMKTYEEAAAVSVPAESASANRLNRMNIIRKALAFVLLVLGFVLFFVGIGKGFWFVGIFVVIAAIIVRSVGKKVLTKQAQQLARSSWRASNAAKVKIGHPETFRTSSTGLYAEVDDFYMALLSPQDKALEMQRRMMEKQLEQQQAQHEEAMAQRDRLAAQAHLDAMDQADAAWSTANNTYDIAYKRPEDRYH
jgi:Flp pilus assembly protein TadB